MSKPRRKKIPLEKFLAWKLKKFPEEFPIKQLWKENPNLFRAIASSEAKNYMDEAVAMDKKERERIMKDPEEREDILEYEKKHGRYNPNVRYAFGLMRTPTKFKGVFQRFSGYVKDGMNQYEAALKALRETGVKVVVIKRGKRRKDVPIKSLTPEKLREFLERKKKS